MKATLLLKKLWLDGKELATADEMKTYCKSLNLDYDRAIRNLLYRGKLVRIFRGVFYIKSPEEIEVGKPRYNHLELVSKGMAAKGIKNWYFGLNTALKLNNMTHEYFAVDDVVSDSVSRHNPIGIAGHSFRFLKFKPELFKFGIIKEKLPYSNPEKTVLDFIYLWRYNSVPKDKILADIEEYARGISKKRLSEYAKHYPKSVSGLVAML